MTTLELANGGSWVKLSFPLQRAPAARVPDKAHGGKRGKVRGFSRGSRRRLLDLLNKVERGAVQRALFVTLTYPGSWPSAWQRWKRDIDALGKRLLRQYPGCAFVWRLEYQKRGAPHFHLILFGVPFVPHSWLAAAWYEIVGSGDERHLQAGTEIRRVRRFRSVIGYASKYLAKVEGGDDARTDGRVWGVVGRSNLPVEIITLEISARVWYSVRRVLRSWVERKTNKPWYAARKSRGGLSCYIRSGPLLRLLAFESARLA